MTLSIISCKNPASPKQRNVSSANILLLPGRLPAPPSVMRPWCSATGGIGPSSAPDLQRLRLPQLSLQRRPPRAAAKCRRTRRSTRHPPKCWRTYHAHINVYKYMYVYIYIYMCVCENIYSCVYPFIYSFTCSFNYPFMYSFIYVFVYSSAYLSIYSCIHLFIHWFVYYCLFIYSLSLLYYQLSCLCFCIHTHRLV